MYSSGTVHLDGHDRLEQDRLRLEHAVLEGHRGRDLERQLVRVDGVERAVVERRLEVDQRVAGEDALRGGLADALLDAREEPTGHGPAHDLLRELDAGSRARLELEPDVAEHAVAAGLLLVPAVDLGLAADRLAVGDRRRCGRDRRPELALEPLGDHGDVRLADRPQDLLAGLAVARRGPWAPPRACAGARGPSCRGRPSRPGRSRPGAWAQGSRWRQVQRGVARRDRVAGLGDAQLGDRADLAGAELGRGLLLLAVEEEQLADALVLALVGVPHRALALQRPRAARGSRSGDRRTGSAVVLNTRASSWLPDAGTSTSLPALSVAANGRSSSGDGR